MIAERRWKHRNFLIKTRRNPKQSPDQKLTTGVFPDFSPLFLQSCTLNVFRTLPVFVRKLAHAGPLLMPNKNKKYIAMSLDTTPSSLLDTSFCDKNQMDNSGLRRRRRTDVYSDHIRTLSEWTPPSLRLVTTLRMTSLNRIISVIFVMLTAASLLHSSRADPDLLRVSSYYFILESVAALVLMKMGCPQYCGVYTGFLSHL